MRPSLAVLACAAALGLLPAQAQSPAAAHVELFDPAGQPAGTARLAETAEGLDVDAELRGLRPGPHGLHFHRDGDCAPGPDAQGSFVPFGAAGGRFDPMETQRHGQPEDGTEIVDAGPDGRGQLRFTRRRLGLQPGKASVMGRTLVVHEHTGEPEAGNAGGRVLCGLVQPGPPGAPDVLLGRHVLPGSQVFPDGIAVDARSGMAYVGSSTEGHLYRIDPQGGRAELLSPGGPPGRQAAFGMRLDASDRLWVAGGTAGTLAVIDRRSGETLHVFESPPEPPPFFNDVAIAGDGFVYVTDSFRPVIYRVPNLPTGELADARLEPWLDLNETPIRFEPGINLNGIAATPDGRFLLAMQSVNGKLWRIDTQSKRVVEIWIADSPPLHNGDGLALDGQALFVVRNAEAEIARLELDANWTRGRMTHRLSDVRLKFPTAAAWSPQGLFVVNGQLDKRERPPPLLPFDVIRLRVP